ncbi:segregation and condensation protein A [Thermonema lapsum]|uniref:Segregation and condensation protein A n=1 Tax=Thermonema lapsum TaxID=28195 RepID=A0A846MTB2_9BACT|nr:segregation/condensation protein A [Thermonema lapsum]NIK74467.1 segregation and condensation protein A [Thermonema lapsum]
MSFEIKLPLFEGPFDLLLFFIERDELDIYDIPIAKITHDFLDYIHQLEKLNIEVAGEFMVVAATLMRIKSKMLLPRPELDEKGNEIDPREELVKHLLEYKKYKSVIDEFARLEDERLKKEARGNLQQELQKLAASNNVEAELQGLDLYKLLRVYEQVMERFRLENKRISHTIEQYPFTIEGQKQMIQQLLQKQRRVSFVEIIKTNPRRIAVIFNFLAILEMAHYGEVRLIIGEGANNFWLETAAAKETEEVST